MDMLEDNLNIRNREYKMLGIFWDMQVNAVHACSFWLVMGRIIMVLHVMI